MKCWVCTRQARGFGHTDLRHGVSDPRRYPIDWVFCSQRCQSAFHALYGHWCRAQAQASQDPLAEVAMIDASDLERAAMRSCLKAFGDAAGEIGFTKPLGDYSEAQALQVIDAIVTRYTDAMVEQHEASQVPPVRGMAPVRDPMAHAFADMADDLPWAATQGGTS